jgi:thiamine biosynthesis protein ThiS
LESLNTVEATIQVTLNGDVRQIPGGRTVTELLVDLGLKPQLVVVEHNREILDRAQYASTEVRAGDALELVHFVGGG